MLVSISLCIEVCGIDPGEHPGDSTVNHFSLFMPLTSNMHVTAVVKACVSSLRTSIYNTISSLDRYLTLEFWLNNWPLHCHYHVKGSFIVNLWQNYCHINHPFITVRVCVQPRTIQFVCRIIMRPSHRGHCQNGGHAPGSEGDCKLHRLSLIVPVILSHFYIILSSVCHRGPLGVLHLQPWLCHLLLGGVLLPAVYCHSAGLHPHLRLPQDEAEEDHLWTSERESATRLNSTVSGETVIPFPFPSTISTIIECYIVFYII